MKKLKITCIIIGIAACLATGFMLLNWMAVVTMSGGVSVGLI